MVPFVLWKPYSEGLFECVVLDGFGGKAASNSKDPPNSYHTSDLWTPHPTLPNRWKYVARIDDRVTLINGEKSSRSRSKAGLGKTLLFAKQSSLVSTVRFQDFFLQRQTSPRTSQMKSSLTKSSQQFSMRIAILKHSRKLPVKLLSLYHQERKFH